MIIGCAFGVGAPNAQSVAEKDGFAVVTWCAWCRWYS